MADYDALDLERAYDCERMLNYTFDDILLLWEALQADGALISRGSMPRYRAGNKRLAIVGNRVLELLLSLKWYNTYQDRLAYDRLSQSILSKKSLDVVGRCNRLERYITLPESARGVPFKTMTATVEAIVGAAYMDGGMEAAKGVMESLRIEATIEEAIRARGDGTDHDKAAEECAPKRKRSQTDELNSCPQVTKNRKLSAESASVKASDQPKRVTSTPDSSSTQPQEERSIHSLVM